MIRLLLVDDQELIRAGLRLILSAEADLEIVGEAADGQAALDVVVASRPDVVLLDMRMPVLDGMGATRLITAGGEDAPRVLALTTFDDDEVLWGALRAGAAGFVLKDAPAAEMVAAIRVTARGGAWLDPRVAGRVLGIVRERRGADHGSRSTIETLSGREVEVLQLVAQGATNPEIAATLYLSERTVKGHISAIFTKLDVRDRAAAIIYAYDAGLANPGT